MWVRVSPPSGGCAARRATASPAPASKNTTTPTIQASQAARGTGAKPNAHGEINNHTASAMVIHSVQRAQGAPSAHSATTKIAPPVHQKLPGLAACARLRCKTHGEIKSQAPRIRLAQSTQRDRISGGFVGFC